MVTLCIADDEALVRASIMARLAATGLEIEVAGCADNLRDAETLYWTVKPDIYLVDINMPGSAGETSGALADGLSLIEKIRAEDGATATQFIIITGYDDFKHLRAAIQAGVRDYLKKPISTAEFTKVLTRTAAFVAENHDVRKKAKNHAPWMMGEKDDRIEQVAEYLRNNYMNETSLQEIALLFYMSPEYLSRRFHQKTGRTLVQFREELRLQKAAELLRHTTLPIADVSSAVGYLDVSYFARLFKKCYGLTPSDCRLSSGHMESGCSGPAT